MKDAQRADSGTASQKNWVDRSDAHEGGWGTLPAGRAVPSTEVQVGHGAPAQWARRGALGGARDAAKWTT